jgi:uncharacterized protein YjiS (DUF1127 family)
MAIHSSSVSGGCVAVRAAKPRRTVGDVARQGLDLLFTWQERARQRRDLAAMPDHLLHDIGVSRSDALSESAKPFWRA